MIYVNQNNVLAYTRRVFMKSKIREKMLGIVFLVGILPINFLIRGLIIVPIITLLLLDWDEREYERRFSHD